MKDPTSVVWRCTAQLRNGQFCDARAMEDAPFPICKVHADKLFEHLTGEPFQIWVARSMLSGPYRLTLETEDEDRARLKAHEKRRAEAFEAQSQVYYVRMGDRVKIGYSTNMRQRLAAFRLTEDSVLATEPGGRELELERHRQFADERVGRIEEFNPSRRLLAHIDSIRREHGEPKITTYVKVVS